MVQIYFHSEHLTLSLYDEIVTYSLDDSQNVWKKKKVVNLSEQAKKNQDFSVECCSFSPCGKYFALCFDKNLNIYETSQWNLFSSAVTDRKGNSVQFFPVSNNLLVADKSGSVKFYAYSKDSLAKIDLNLGHNSMLTGALITDDERFIVTCDRDEKIRVSNYPNVYNIECYCLGHEQFISHIEFLPTDKKVLVSASGDGTVRFWDFVLGKQLALFSLQKPKLSGEKTPFVKSACCKKETNISYVALQEYKTTEVVILKAIGNTSQDIQIEIYKTIQLSGIPWDIAFWKKNLVAVVSDNLSPVTMWSFNETSIDVKKSIINIEEYLCEKWESLLSKSLDSVAVLFKRDIDNVQEYQLKKKARLLKANNTSQVEVL